jgi:Tfp pilus assembly protein PilW
MHAGRGEGGFSVIEVLVAAMMGLIILGAAVSVFIGSLQSQPRTLNRGAQIETGRTTMERIIREVRQGASLPVANASQLTMITFSRSATCTSADTSCRVTYTCSSGSCSRAVANPDGSGSQPASRVVTGLLTSNVFTYRTCPTDSTRTNYVGITLPFDAGGGEDAITLQDGADLRNQCQGL